MLRRLRRLRRLRSRAPVGWLGALAAIALLLTQPATAGWSKGAQTAPTFKVLAFYTGKNDLAHISFVDEANEWFPEAGRKNGFVYESTSDWTKLNGEVLSAYQVVLFLDTRPDEAAQREAFRKYMEGGGAWMGFHFAGFALTPSKYPQNWDWYHDEFLGAGSYVSNTWRPTQAVLRVEAGQSSGDERPGGHVELGAERVVSVGEGPARQQGHPDPPVDRSVEFPARHGPEAA